jgi:hypothetical protein
MRAKINSNGSDDMKEEKTIIIRFFHFSLFFKFFEKHK